jgi:hypothetical protein
MYWFVLLTVVLINIDKIPVFEITTSVTGIAVYGSIHV